jgi:hypothetical protein
MTVGLFNHPNFKLLAYGSSKGVECLPHHPNVKGSSPDTDKSFEFFFKQFEFFGDWRADENDIILTL